MNKWTSAWFLGFAWICNAAEVRIPLNIQPQIRIPVQLLSGELKSIDKNLKPVLKFIRADVSRPNRFYVEDLLIESIPEDIDLKHGHAKFSFRISKSTALEDGLEEYLGQMQLTIELEKVKEDLFVAKSGFEAVTFTSRIEKQKPITVGLGFKAPSQPSRIATQMDVP